MQLPTGSIEDKPGSAILKFAGLIAVAVACTLSGIAGVWFEKVLKGSEASLWARNVQLSFFSVLPGFFVGGKILYSTYCLVLIMDGDAYQSNGFFQGYTVYTYAAILCQALGGLIVAVVVK